MLLNNTPLRFVLVLIGFCILALFVQDEAEGKVWYVDDDGGQDFLSIQDAVNASEDGDTIRVWDGTYYENVVVNRSVSLVGNGSASTVIDGGGEEDVVRIEADWVNLSGFLITGSGDSHRDSDSGIKVEADHCHFFSNNCSDNFYGISIEDSSSCMISNNTYQNNSYYGIRLWDSSYDCTVTNNTCSGSEEGIYVGGSSTYITSNTVLNSSNGIGLGGSNNIISRNRCVNNFVGVRVGGDNNIIIGNNLSANWKGISLQYADNNTIMNNTISSNSWYGISLSNLYNENTIKGNTITNNGQGIFLHSYRYTTVTGKSINTNNSITGNIISNNTKNGINATRNNRYTIKATNNWWGNGSGPYHPVRNPDGKGDNVTDFVDFSPWRDENGEKVYPPPREKSEEDASISGLSCLLLLLIIVLLSLLVIVVRLPDSFSGEPGIGSDKENESSADSSRRVSSCPHCGGKFEMGAQKRGIRFRCTSVGKESSSDLLWEN